MLWFLWCAMLLPPSGGGEPSDPDAMEQTAPLAIQRDAWPAPNNPDAVTAVSPPSRQIAPEILDESDAPTAQRPAVSPPTPMARPAGAPAWRGLAPTRLWLALGAAVALVVVIAGIGVAVLHGSRKTAATATHPLGPTATATLIPTPTLPTGFTRYTDPAGAWAIALPATVKPVAGSQVLLGVTATTTTMPLSSDGASLTLYSLPTAFNQNQAQPLFDELVSELGASQITIVQQPTPVKIGAVTWYQLTITASIEALPTRVSVLYTAYGTGSFAISEQAPTASFAADSGQFFALMLPSFVFLR